MHSSTSSILYFYKMSDLPVNPSHFSLPPLIYFPPFLSFPSPVLGWMNGGSPAAQWKQLTEECQKCLESAGDWWPQAMHCTRPSHPLHHLIHSLVSHSKHADTPPLYHSSHFQKHGVRRNGCCHESLSSCMVMKATVASNAHLSVI